MATVESIDEAPDYPRTVVEETQGDGKGKSEDGSTVGPDCGWTI